ncbi:SpoIVB peptidase S55 domain-containing protein [Gemmatimonadota bacterium]
MTINYLLRKFQSAVFLALLVTTGNSSGQQIMPSSEVEAGMQGWGLSVFSGDSIERFDVKIIGKLNNFLPKKDIILGELLGERLRHTGVIGGMSGSPIYIGDKLVGALAYGWQFSKDPIFGITPIEQMLEIEKSVTAGGGAAAPQGGAAARRSAASPARFDPFTAPPNPLLDDVAEQRPAAGSSAAGGAPLTRLEIPLIFAGCSPAVIERFGGTFNRLGLVPMAGGNGGGSPADSSAGSLQPGSAVAAQLVRGDLSLAATGTLTYRDGDKVLAFGHPFMQFGPVDFPMAAAEIVTVLPNVARSFKISNTTGVQGSILGDHTSGVFGVIGAAPEMVPIQINLKLPSLPEESFHYEIVRNKMLSPVLSAVTMLNSLSDAGNTVSDMTLKVSGTVDIAGTTPVRLENLFAGPSANSQLIQQILLTMQYLYANYYGPADVRGVSFDIEVAEGFPRARVAEVYVDSDELVSGDTLQVDIALDPFVTPSFMKHVRFVAPATDIETRLFLLVGSGDFVTRTEFQLSPGRFLYTSLEELVELINETRKNNYLYVKAFTMDRGLVLGGSEMPELPGSVWTMLKSEKSSGVTLPLNDKTVAEFAIRTDYVLNGFRLLQLTLKPKP